MRSVARTRATERAWQAACRALDGLEVPPGPARAALFWRLFEAVLEAVERCRWEADTDEGVTMEGHVSGDRA